MIAGESKGKTSAPVIPRYFVYILTCSDGTLYVGSTSDLLRRERTHNRGRGAKYTAGRTPVRIVYSEPHESRSAAQSREAQLKRWPRSKKQDLINGTPGVAALLPDGNRPRSSHSRTPRLRSGRS
jgi:putative endonuclease